MSLTHFFYEPFYSASDWDRVFDEAFAARGFPNSQVDRPQRPGHAQSLMKPKYVT